MNYQSTYTLLCADNMRSVAVSGGDLVTCDSYGNKETSTFPLEPFNIGCNGLPLSEKEYSDNPRHFINVPGAIEGKGDITFDEALNPLLIDLMHGL